MRTPGADQAPRGPEIKSRADVEKVARVVEDIVPCPASDAYRQWPPIPCTDVADADQVRARTINVVTTPMTAPIAAIRTSRCQDRRFASARAPTSSSCLSCLSSATETG